MESLEIRFVSVNTGSPRYLLGLRSKELPPNTKTAITKEDLPVLKL